MTVHSVEGHTQVMATEMPEICLIGRGEGGGGVVDV